MCRGAPAGARTGFPTAPNACAPALIRLRFIGGSDPPPFCSRHDSIAGLRRNRGHGPAVTHLSLLAFSGPYGSLAPTCWRPVTTESADVTTINDTIRKFGYPTTTVAEYERWVVLLRPQQATF